MEVEDVASTDRMVGAEGANVCVCVIEDKSKHFISQCDTPGQQTYATPQREVWVERCYI